MKYVLLSGASGGLGQACKKYLLNKGYFVIGVDIIKDEEVIDNFISIKCDLTNDNDIAALYEQIKTITNHLDAIINLVGIFKFQSLIEGNEEDFRKCFEINFFSIYKINKKMFDLLDETSRIINMSSEEAIYSPQPFVGYYSITKCTLDMYNDVLRRECNYLNIKVIKIVAGSFKTKLLTKVEEEYQSLVKNSKLFVTPLTKLRHLMDNELNKNHSPDKLAKLIIKILRKKKPHIVYKINKSFALRFLNILPNKLQDKIYVWLTK